MSKAGQVVGKIGWALMVVALCDFALGWIGIALDKQWTLLPRMVINHTDYAPWFFGIAGLIVTKIANLFPKEEQ